MTRIRRRTCRGRWWWFVFHWVRDRPPRTRYDETVIYEVHVRGLTKLHPLIPQEQRGTCQGLAHPAVIQYLQRLGVTAVELMPVHQFVPEGVLAGRGRSNYWGYNTIGFFAPHNAYAAGGTRGQQVPEFKSMVRALHQAGIEVILDVVYDHTAEGDHQGPTLSFRGIDNAAYYRLENADPRFYRDTTGTGNGLRGCGTRTCSRWWSIRCGMGCWRCTWTGSGSPAPPRSPASSTRWTGCPRSSTWSSRIRWSPRPS